MSHKDDYGRHECLDRTCTIMNMVDTLLLKHGGLTPDEREVVERVHQELFDLYQDIGRRHLLPQNKQET